MFYVSSENSCIETVLEQLRSRMYTHLSALSCEVYTSQEPLPFERRWEGKRQALAVGDSWGGLFDCGWFHFVGDVPAHGADAMVRLDVSGEGLVVDANGDPIVGLTNVHSIFDVYYQYCLAKREVPLELCVNADGRIDIWMDAGCNDLFGGLKDNGVFALAEVADVNKEIVALFYDMEVLFGLWRTMDGNSAYARRLYGAIYRAALKMCDYTSDEVAAARAELKPYLDNTNGYTPVTLTAIGQAHLDLAWLWPERESIRKGARTFSTALRMMEESPEYIFGASQAQLYQWIKDYYPNLYTRVKERVAEGRWDVQGALWVEPDTNLTGGEALIRQFLYGKKFFKGEFGQDMETLWLPDCFGFSAVLPQIMKKCGVSYFFTNKLYGNKNRIPHQSFIWRGNDGSEVLAHMTPTGMYNSTLCGDDLKRSQDGYLDADVSDEAIILFGIGDGGGGPGREHLERLSRLGNLYGHPRLRIEKSLDFFRRLDEKRDQYARWCGELYFEWHQGTYTTQSHVKKYNRQAENAIRLCEMVCSIAAREHGFAYPAEELERIWKRILFMQFHDVIPGSSITRVYQEAEAEYGKLLGEIGEITATASACLQSGWFNASSAAQSGFLKENGSWKAYTAAPFAYARLEDASQRLSGMENEYIKLTFDDAGALLSVYDKEYSRELLKPNSCGNRLEVYSDDGDAWELAVDYRRRKKTVLTASEIRLTVDGPTSILHSEYLYGSSRICQDVVLTAGSREVRFDTWVDWQESEKTLRAAFDTTVLSDQVVCGIQCGELRRPAHSNTSWQKDMYEICADRYVDLCEAGYGVSLLSTSKFGYYAKDGTLDICLLRSPNWPDGQADRGEHSFSYSLYPHGGNTEQGGVPQLAERMNHPICRLQGNGAPVEGYISISASNVFAETLKRAEDGRGYVLRLYEASGRLTDTTIAVKNMTACWATDMLENPEKELAVEEEAVSVRLTPYEILTLRFC